MKQKMTRRKKRILLAGFLLLLAAAVSPFLISAQVKQYEKARGAKVR